MGLMRNLLVTTLSLLSVAAFADQPITVTILHTNDLHAHAEPTNIAKKPYGGYARQATLIQRFRKSDPNVILLNAGDTFQGTLYFNVYEGLVDLTYMNYIGYQAMTIGNHEFDRGPSTLATFVKQAAFPVLSANLDFTAEPALSGLVQPTTILTVNGEKVGIVGATTPDVPNISNPGPNVKVLDLVPTIQKSVDDLTKQGINKIILLSHLGYEEDLELAPKVKGIDVIVGGHSHTPLALPTITGFPKSRGDYPTMTKGLDGAPVAVVQAWEWGKVLGRLQVDFDQNGKVSKVHDAAPVPVDESIPADKTVTALLAAAEKPILALKSQVVGSTETGLAKEGRGDSPMADVIADAMLAATSKYGAVAAFINAGGVRGSFEAGNITYGQAISVQPFSNTLVVLDVTGEELVKSLEKGTGGGILLPSEGTSYKVSGGKVTDVIVAGKPVDLAKTYPIAFLSFTAGGGDSHFVLRDAKGKRVDTGIIDLDALIDYLKAHKPTNAPKGKRVVSE